MRLHYRLLIVAITLLLSGCLGVSTNNQVPAPTSLVNEESWRTQRITFPSVTVYDLEGEVHSFPQEFKGYHTLMLIAFKHEQQALLNPWLVGTVGLAKEFPKFKVVEMPTIERSSAAFRAMVNNGMRSGISEEDARRRTMTLYVNKREFLESIGIKDEGKVYALLVNEHGVIVWRRDGDYSQTLLDELRQYLTAASVS